MSETEAEGGKIPKKFKLDHSQQKKQPRFLQKTKGRTV